MKERKRKFWSVAITCMLVMELIGLNGISVNGQTIIDTDIVISTLTEDDYQFVGDSCVLEVESTGEIRGTVYGSGGIVKNAGTIGSLIRGFDSVINAGTIQTIELSRGTVTNTGTIGTFQLKSTTPKTIQMNGGSITSLTAESYDVNEDNTRVVLQSGTIGTLSGGFGVEITGNVSIARMEGGMSLTGNGTVNVSEFLGVTSENADVSAKINVGKNTEIVAGDGSKIKVYYKDVPYVIAEIGTLAQLKGVTISERFLDSTTMNEEACQTFSQEKYLYKDSVVAVYQAADGYYFPEDYQPTTEGSGTITVNSQSPQSIEVTYTVGENDKDAIVISLPAAKKKEKQKGQGTVAVDTVYYGTNVSPVIESKTNGTDAVSFEYKKRGASDTTYTTTMPTEVGAYTIRAVFKATEEYTQVTATDDFEITYLPIPQDAYRFSGSGKNGYYRELSILPKAGYKIAAKLDGSYLNALTLQEGDSLDAVYLMRISDGAKTSAVLIGNYKMDTTMPGMNVMDGTTYYGKSKKLSIYDENLQQVIINGKSQEVTGTRFDTELMVASGIEKYEIVVEDKAGNVTKATIRVAEDWVKSGDIPTDTSVNLLKGSPYKFGSGTWKIDGDTTKYNGNQTFYISEDGAYTFRKQ